VGPRVAALAVLLLLAGAEPSAAAINEFPLPTAGGSPTGVATGTDGNVWLTEASASRIARVTPAGTATEFALPAGREPLEIVSAGGLLWFTERAGDRIGRIDPNAADVQGSLAEFSVPGAGSHPTGITAGPDGALWFTEADADQIGRITTAGVVTNEFGVPGSGSKPSGIAAGPDGNLWFTEPGSSEVGRVTTTGVFTEFPVQGLRATSSRPDAITAGPDGALWYTDPGLDHVHRVTIGGTQSQFAAPADAGLEGIAAGPDGNLWLTEGRSGKVARMSTTGAVSEYTLPASGAGPSAITTGPDGALWFAERLAGNAGRITTDTPPDAPPAGAQGPAGPSGGSGTPGPPGPTGPAGQAKLVLVAFQLSPAHPRAGRRLRVRFAITDAAGVVLQVRKGRGKARTVTRKAVTKAGVQTLTWNGKLGRAKAKPGRYDLVVQATKDGRSASSRLRVRLR
jgi:streptogramin lyase